MNPNYKNRPKRRPPTEAEKAQAKKRAAETRALNQAIRAEFGKSKESGA